MTDREKLTQLIYGNPEEYISEGTCMAIADHLLANGVTFQKWIPVTERKPDLELVEAKGNDFELFPCLVVKTNPLYPKKRYVTKAWYDGVGFIDTDCIRITKTVTHWMPLPEPPKEE